jgi:hypothetical protein
VDPLADTLIKRNVAPFGVPETETPGAAILPTLADDGGLDA